MGALKKGAIKKGAIKLRALKKGALKQGALKVGALKQGAIKKGELKLRALPPPESGADIDKSSTSELTKRAGEMIPETERPASVEADESRLSLPIENKVFDINKIEVIYPFNFTVKENVTRRRNAVGEATRNNDGGEEEGQRASTVSAVGETTPDREVGHDSVVTRDTRSPAPADVSSAESARDTSVDEDIVTTDERGEEEEEEEEHEEEEEEVEQEEEVEEVVEQEEQEEEEMEQEEEVEEEQETPLDYSTSGRLPNLSSSRRLTLDRIVEPVYKVTPAGV